MEPGGGAGGDADPHLGASHPARRPSHGGLGRRLAHALGAGVQLAVGEPGVREHLDNLGLAAELAAVGGEESLALGRARGVRGFKLDAPPGRGELDARLLAHVLEERPLGVLHGLVRGALVVIVGGGSASVLVGVVDVGPAGAFRALRGHRQPLLDPGLGQRVLHVAHNLGRRGEPATARGVEPRAALAPGGFPPVPRALLDLNLRGPVLAEGHARLAVDALAQLPDRAFLLRLVRAPREPRVVRRVRGLVHGEGGRGAGRKDGGRAPRRRTRRRAGRAPRG